jgi:hypothetical protein
MAAGRASPRLPERAAVEVDHRIGELGDGDAVAAGDLEDQPDRHRSGQGQPLAPEHRGHEEGHHDGDDCRAPKREAAEKQCQVRRNQQHREDAGQEEDERVQQGEDAKALCGLAEQVGRQRRRDPACVGGAGIGAQQGDVLVHGEDRLPTRQPACRSVMSNTPSRVPGSAGAGAGSRATVTRDWSPGASSFRIRSRSLSASPAKYIWVTSSW